MVVARTGLLIAVIGLVAGMGCFGWDTCQWVARDNQKIGSHLYDLTSHTTGAAKWRQDVWLDRFKQPSYVEEVRLTRASFQKQLDVNNAFLKEHCSP